MAAAARAASAAARSPLLVHHRRRLPQVPSGGGGSLRVGGVGIGAGRGWEGRRRTRIGVRVFARYSQAQDFSTRLQDRVVELPKLVEDLLQTSISTGPRGAFRMAQGIQAVLGVGGEWLTDLSKTANTSAGIPSQMQLGLLSPVYLRRLFERMGATYVKLGQVRASSNFFIASAPTLFPAEYVEEFQNCFDRAPSVPYDVIESILREELQRPLDSIYEYIDPVPIASASIAQVHGARLKSSQKDVVIKVLKPGIEDTLVADLNFIYVVARVLEFLNPELQRTSLVGIVKDIKESMLEEVDFRKEAANIQAFQGYIDAMGFDRQAKAPFVYQHCSTKRVLTMERLYGVPLTDLDSIRSLVPDPELTLVTALNVWFGSLISCESFHADVHAGNLWLLRDGRIGFIDFGIVGRISPRTWAAMEVFLASFATEDYDAMATALSEMGATGNDIDINEFSKDLRKIFSSIQDLDTEIIVATARGPDATAVSANVVLDERQMNALFLDLVSYILC
ncbi:putative aarF domain-containing protein kinase [Dichanthelium oligosanthes]|uniref:Putative aarF domain-containing protein kinase n=1 Tax=Dichanthelium oligosanthes TaxID=888268 RepID=A0A1E5USM4_9POAL|nr:putative aarF domain-containing protein kinase [Dichanthelium oligosanthes]